MNAFFFKEDRLLKLKKQQVTIAELQLAKAAREVKSFKQAVDAILTRIGELDKQLGRKNSPVFMHASQLAIGMRTRLQESRTQLAEKEKQWAIAFQRLRKANRAVESLTALETRQFQMHTRKVQNKEQAEIDSLSTLKWMKQSQVHV